MQSAPKVTIGMDVADRYSRVVVLDNSGPVVLRDQIPTTEPGVRAWFKRFAGARVALVGNARQIALDPQQEK